MNRIEWEGVTPGTGYVGFVRIANNRVKIASVSWSFDRADKKPWVLRTEIPGWKNARHHVTAEEAKESADRILTSFVTAMRPDAPDAAEVRLAAENAHESGYPDNRFGDFLHGFVCAVNWLNGGRG